MDADPAPDDDSWAEGVRTAVEAADAAALARLLRDFNTEFDTSVPPLPELTQRFARLLERDDVVALLTGPVAEETGFALVTLRPTVYWDGPVALLEELYVVPQLRGRGLGTTLLTEAMRLARALGSEEMQIGVDEGDHDTRRFYERHGFTHTLPGSDERMFFYEREL